MRLLRRHFGILLGSTALAACQTASATLERLKTPTSMIDLLVNIREVTRSGFILERSFMTDQNINRVFGGSTVKFDEIVVGPTVQVRARITDFPRWPDVKPVARDPREVTVTWYKGNISNFTPVGDIRISENETSALPFEVVEQVFGKAWVRMKEVPPYISPHGWYPPPPPPPTHRMGDAEVVFQLNASLDRKVVVWFRPDGTMSGLEASANGALRGK
jgi:hypothetical protein